MPNIIKKITERLNLPEDMEMMPNEISEKLEQELMKPENEIDVQLVNELLDRLNTAEPTQQESEECWAAIQNRLKQNNARRGCTFARRCATIAAVLVLVCLVSFGTARAFRWTFLMKLFAPLAETFGIYTTSNLESDVSDPAPVEGVAVYTLADTEYLQLSYDSIEEMPETENGHRLIPGWVPERFEFVQGSIYEDPDVFLMSVTYQSGDDLLNMNVKRYFTEAAVGDFHFEKLAAEEATHYILEQEVTFYKNTQEHRLSAVWMVQNMYYILQGNLTEAEMTGVIESVLK